MNNTLLSAIHFLILLCFWFFKTGLLYVAQAVLKLTEFHRLALNLQSSACLCLPRAGSKGMHHHHPAYIFFQKLLLLLLFFKRGWLFCLHVCLCTTWVPGAHGRPKKVLDHQELELPVSGSCHMGAGDQTWLLWKGSQCLNRWATSPSLAMHFHTHSVPAQKPVTLALLSFFQFFSSQIRKQRKDAHSSELECTQLITAGCVRFGCLFLFNWQNCSQVPAGISENFNE